jgi:SdrD B-like domain/Pilus formation protein N terminal region
MHGWECPLFRQQRWMRGLVLLAIAVLGFWTARAGAQGIPSEALEVYWHESRTVPMPGVTQVVILDESICSAQISADQVRLFGLSRGETVAFIWAKDQRMTVRVRIVAPPVVAPPPRLSQSDLDALGHGYAGSSTQTFIGPQGNTDFFFLHHLDWQQESQGRRLAIHAQAQDSTTQGSPLFNANSASIQYSTPQTDVSLIDFPLTVNGGMESNLSPHSAYNVYMIRGAEVGVHRGGNTFEFFGGATIPSYYLTLSGTRSVGGFNFNRKQSEKLYLYTTTGWVSSPRLMSATGSERTSSIFQTAGLAYRPNLKWSLQGTAGGSTRGGLAQGTVSYSGDKITAFLSGTSSSAEFPLNQLQLFYAGGTSLTAGVSLQANSRLSGFLYYQHSATKSSPFFPGEGTSDYLNPNLNLAITPREAITLNYTYRRSRSGLAVLGQSQEQRFDIQLNSRLGAQISNTAEVALGSLNDPLQFNTEGQFTIRDLLNIPSRWGFLTFGLEHTRSNPSLVKKLNEEIGLLSPQLQQLFLLNPVAFVESSLIPPEVLALLENLQPTDTEASITGQFRIGDRLSFNPMAGYAHNAAGLGRTANSTLFGYTLSYQVTPSLQLVSSLSNVFLYNPQQQGVRRTTVVTVGFNRAFGGTPRWLIPVRRLRGTIRGRVFRDLNVNGTYNTGEPGFAGLKVDLSTGQSVSTDSQGRFEFSGLAPGAYWVRFPLDQFTESVRATTSTEVRADLVHETTAEVNFGIVNFARVMGNVFNDYTMDGKRQPDAAGVRGVRITLEGNGSSRGVITDGGGDYEFDEVLPGDYELTLDHASLPSDFIAPMDATRVHVSPTTTLTQDVSLRALRSISGHVYFRPNGNHASNGQGVQGIPGSGQPKNHEPSGSSQVLRPLAGVRLAIDHTTTTTDANGAFIIRNLPAGEFVLTLVPASPLPPGLAVPQGKVRLPREPIQINNATIVISNPELLKYLASAPPASGP